jgi:hypothetical protein
MPLGAGRTTGGTCTTGCCGTIGTEGITLDAGGAAVGTTGAEQLTVTCVAPLFVPELAVITAVPGRPGCVVSTATMLPPVATDDCGVIVPSVVDRFRVLPATDVEAVMYADWPQAIDAGCDATVIACAVPVGLQSNAL